jgi:hypothetical protein
MTQRGRKPEKEDGDVSFGAGTTLFLVIFVLSNLYEGIYNRYLSERFESTWAVYIISLLLLMIPILFLAVTRKRTLARWARSMNFGVLMIVVITVATILGTLIFQKRMPQEYINAYGETLFSVFIALHMIDLFHSAWFVNVLFMLIINIAYCYISRREFTLRNLGGYILHFGIIVSLSGAFIGFVWGVKGVIQVNEGDEEDTFIVRTRGGPPQMSLGYNILLDDFAIEWYEPKYLVNTFRVTHLGGELISSLNVEKKTGLSVAEAGVTFEVVGFSENGVADVADIAETVKEDVKEGMPPYPILSIMVEDESLRRQTHEDAKASGWLAAYDEMLNKFEGVFNTDAVILFSWQKPETLVSVLEGREEEASQSGEVSHIVVYNVGGTRKNIEVETGKAYRLEETPYVLRVTGFYPDFKIDDGVAYSPTDELLNPTLSIEITDTENPEMEYRTTYLFAREELKGMMHGGGLPEGLEVDYEIHGTASGGETKVFIVGEDNTVYVIKGTRLVSEGPIEFGTPVPFKASGHDLLLSVQELYQDQPLCGMIVQDGGKTDTLVISPLFSDPIRHSREGYVSTFRRERDILDYKSRVRILENGEEIMAKTIEVNHPLTYGGFAIYQQSYNEVDWTWTGFEVVRDPGLWMVYFGFIMMCIGSIYVFYIRPGIKKK